MRTIHLREAPSTGLRIVAEFIIFSAVGLAAAGMTPCMAQSPDGFRSAPSATPDPFRSAPAATPAKPVSRPASRQRDREIEPRLEPAVATPPIDAELSSWQAINTSNNVADFEAFLTRFPQSRFNDLARNRIAVLRPPVPATAVTAALPPSPAAAPSSPTGQSREIQRSVPRDTESRAAMSWNSSQYPRGSNCVSNGLPVLTIVDPPKSGTVRFDTAVHKPPQCPNEIQVTAAFYKPRPGFIGQDQFSYIVKSNYAAGLDRRVRVTVTVQ
jgi:hypothetical protein